jgi:hypothetical protein
MRNDDTRKRVQGFLRNKIIRARTTVGEYQPHRRDPIWLSRKLRGCCGLLDAWRNWR